jgi:hypothetical protein
VDTGCRFIHPIVRHAIVQTLSGAEQDARTSGGACSQCGTHASRQVGATENRWAGDPWQSSATCGSAGAIDMARQALAADCWSARR